MGSFSALLTAFYSIRLIYLTFIINTNSKKRVFIKVRESYWNIILPLFLLAFGSIFVGYFGKELMLSNSILPIIWDFVKIVPLLLSLLGALLAFMFYDYFSLKYKYIRIRGLVENAGLIGRMLDFYYMVYTFFNSAWQFNYVINNFVIFNILNFAHLVTYRVIDRGLLEIIGPNGISGLLIRLTQNISNFQSGMVFNYVLIMIVFTVLLISGYRYF